MSQIEAAQPAAQVTKIKLSLIKKQKKTVFENAQK